MGKRHRNGKKGIETGKKAWKAGKKARKAEEAGAFTNFIQKRTLG